MKRQEPQRKALSDEQREEAAPLKRIWDARKQKLKLTQEKAAEELGYSTQGAISHYLNARIALNTDALLAFANLLGVSPAEIRPSLASVLTVSPIPSPPARAALRRADIVIKQIQGMLDPLGLTLADLQGDQRKIRTRIAEVLKASGQDWEEDVPAPTGKGGRTRRPSSNSRAKRKPKAG